MPPTVRLTSQQRGELLRIYRKDPDPEVRFRAHILLLLAGGHPWAVIETILFCSSRTINRWRLRFEREGLEGLSGRKRGRPFRLGPGWVAVVVAWVTTKTPRDFGLLRLPADETVVWQDEVEVHTNPKIGRMWMPKGQQATVPTPGTNRKRHLAGSIHWRTGQVFVTEAAPKQGRDAALFIAHLDDLRRRLRRYRKIHVICDNAGYHTSQAAIEYLWDHEGRIEVHLLPKYAPETNPIERVWWLLHEHVTRNHRCQTLEELLGLVFAWLEQQAPFTVEDAVYRDAAAA